MRMQAIYQKLLELHAHQVAFVLKTAVEYLDCRLALSAQLAAPGQASASRYANKRLHKR